MKLTIAYITSRTKPEIGWFFDSLAAQMLSKDEIQIIVVSSNIIKPAPPYPEQLLPPLWTHPKPTIWQGKHRVTKEDWWAASNARNTAICLCKTDWIAFVDDRCVLLPGWINSIRQAMKHGYGVCGSYEKRTVITVENGVIKHSGIVIGEDGRVGNPTGVVKAPGEWAFGCSVTLPLEWMLTINGYDETCDGLSMEDVIAGLMLQNNGFPLMYDMRMKMIEDRTPEHSGPAMRREDKGVSPNDKSHAMLNMLRYLKSAMHIWNPTLNLRELRSHVLNGGEFPAPEQKQYTDWYDGTVINGL